MRLLLLTCLVSLTLCGQTVEDPLARVFAETPSSVDQLISSYRAERALGVDGLPLPSAEFTRFQSKMVGSLQRSLHLDDWLVRNPSANTSPLVGLYRDHLLEIVELHGVEVELHLIELVETGERVPAALALPAGDAVRPGVACFSGHSRRGLHDLVVDLDSYQQGVAIRLAQAGFASIAVEKLDTGYLAREAPDGVDELEIASFRLGMGRTTREAQIKASLAAVEILALHPRVDAARIGATGVSLGGWLAVQTALFTDRIGAVADFGRKTVYLPDEAGAEQFGGVTDLCHVMPSTFLAGDRNLTLLPYAPRPLLAGHGRADKGSHAQHERYYKQPFERQYRELGEPDAFSYHIHAGGDTMPSSVVIDWFRRIFPFE